VASVIRYFNADSVGGDGTTDALTGANAAYATLAAWQTAEATNLVTAGDTHKLILNGDTDVTSAFTLSSTAGWTTSATYDLTMERASDSSMKILVAASWTAVFYVQVANVKLDNLWVENTTTSAFQPFVFSFTGGDLIVDRCVGIANVQSNNNIYNIGNQPANSTTIIARSVGAGATVGLDASWSNITVKLYNNTLYGNARNYETRGCTHLIMKNNLGTDSGTQDYDLNLDHTTVTTSNNVSSDATSPDTAYRNKTVTYTDAANDDFSLASSDTGATGQGADLSSDPDYPFSTDRVGVTFGNPWSSGAYAAFADASSNDFASTLGPATLVAAGNTVTSSTGTLSSTLDNSTLAATGSAVYTGTLTATLSDATLNAAGSLAFTGSLSQTLDDTTQSAAGLLSFIGTMSTALDDVTLAASGTSISAGAEGTLTATLDDTLLAAQGAIDPIGLLGITLDPTSLNASGLQQVAGTFTDLLSNASLAAVGGTGSADEGLCMRIIHDREYNSFSESFSQRDNESIIYQINFTRLMVDRGSSISSVTWSSNGATITNPSLASNITQATLRSSSRHNTIKVVATQADGVNRIKTIDLRTIDSDSSGGYN